MLLCLEVYLQVLRKALEKRKFSKDAVLKYIVVWGQLLLWKKVQKTVTSKKMLKN